MSFEHSPAVFAMLHSNNASQLSPVVNHDRDDNMVKEKSPLISHPARNVAFAVNYSLPSVDQFIPHSGSARMPSDRVQSTEESTKTSDVIVPTPTRTELVMVEKDMNRERKRVRVVETDRTPSKRVSQRERKPREKLREKVRVRYDMNHVPTVQRHSKFVQHHRTQSHNHHNKRRTLPPRLGSNPSTRTARETAQDQESLHNTCHKCKGEELPAPFVADTSVVWIPTKRTEWEDCLSEMTALCTSAALRRHMASPSSTPKTFFAPLSQDYIRDRIDIDDPLEGYQIRHKTGGWLQGFILWTNFTTWTHYFKWDSLHEMSGIQSTDALDKKALVVDLDGSLSSELEAQPRSGDPLSSGVVFPTLAEISLLGGIGCGEYLLRMALDDIKSRGQYKYVVLQATDQSRTFYERFGFVRVGAVCRYGSHETGRVCMQGQTNESDIVGYRHWTYANERNLDKYGGPSYMMALRLPSTNHDNDAIAACSQCASHVQKPTVIEQLKAVAVEKKPEVTQLAAAPTPFKRRSSLTPVSKPAPLEGALMKAPSSQPKLPLPTDSLAPARVAPAKASSSSPFPKRRKIAAAAAKEQLEKLMTPPSPGQALSFAQKQYQSIWLAVPPAKSTSGGRRPPRPRTDLPKPVSRKKHTPNKNPKQTPGKSLSSSALKNLKKP